MKRYFEFVGGSSAKFYEVTVRSNAVTTRFGRIGTEGQIQSKNRGHRDGREARREGDRAKLAKGYWETVAC